MASTSTPPPSGDSRARLLVETARQLGSTLDPPAIFARLRESVCGAMACDGLIVSSYDAAAGMIRCLYAWVGGNLVDPATLPVLKFNPESQGMQTQVIRTGKPMLFSDVAERAQNPKGTYYEVDAAGGVRNLREGGPPLSRGAVMVPLRLEGVVVGVVQVMADHENAYTSNDLELLEGISLLLAVALENARLFRRAQEELAERTHLERALRDADRRKDEFIATLGHELRNPLSPIRNAVAMLRLKTPAVPELASWYDVIDRQVDHFARLIDDLLDVSRIAQGRLELRRQRVELSGIVREAVASCRSTMEQLGHRLTVTLPAEPMVVDADSVRLAQVFTNLLDNAAKYTERDGNVAIVVEHEGAVAVVTVRDDGAGVPPDALPRLFDLFYQADHSMERSTGGLGIGLTITKQLVDLHGGAITATSEGVGRGSQFVVRLPLAAGEVVAETAAATDRPFGFVTGRRVLVADDNLDAANSMAMLLQMAGNDVAVAFDGQQAIEESERFRPDVLLLDLGMPKRSGYDVARWLRDQPWGKAAWLVAATGWGQDDARRRALEAGFDVHVVKPIDLAALGRTLDELAAGRGA